MNAALYTDDQRMHEMVERALSESWQVVHGHIERKGAIFERVVRARASKAGEFAPADPVLAVALRAGGAAALLPSGDARAMRRRAGARRLDEMTEFVLGGLRYRPA